MVDIINVVGTHIKSVTFRAIILETSFPFVPLVEIVQSIENRLETLQASQ